MQARDVGRKMLVVAGDAVAFYAEKLAVPWGLAPHSAEFRFNYAH